MTDSNTPKNASILSADQLSNTFVGTDHTGKFISVADLMKIIADFTDGNQWYDIQTVTGLSDDKCKYIDNVGTICAKAAGYL